MKKCKNYYLKKKVLLRRVDVRGELSENDIFRLANIDRQISDLRHPLRTKFKNMLTPDFRDKSIKGLAKNAMKITLGVAAGVGGLSVALSAAPLTTIALLYTGVKYGGLLYMARYRYKYDPQVKKQKSFGKKLTRVGKYIAYELQPAGIGEAAETLLAEGYKPDGVQDVAKRIQQNRQISQSETVTPVQEKDQKQVKQSALSDAQIRSIVASCVQRR